MKSVQLISIALFTVAVVLTAYGWMDRLKSTNPKINEAFDNQVMLDDASIAKLQKANEPVPTDAEAVTAHQTLLRYMRNDFTKGIRFAQDFGTRFYGDNLPFRKDLDTRTLMDNYRSPLQ
jgi:hypothetical protein